MGLGFVLCRSPGVDWVKVSVRGMTGARDRVRVRVWAGVRALEFAWLRLGNEASEVGVGLAGSCEQRAGMV